MAFEVTSFPNATARPEADDPRNDLAFEFLELLELLSPPFFLLENVGGFMTGRAQGTEVVPAPMPRVLARLIALGYQARVVTLCSAHYRVPQARRRIFVMAAKVGLPLPLPPPPTSHYRDGGKVGSAGAQIDSHAGPLGLGCQTPSESLPPP